MDMRLEVIALPVEDVDRAKNFYTKLGFREDIDYVWDDDFRVVQFTPPGSSCSIIIGKGITKAVPGSVKDLILVVENIVAAYDELMLRGIEVGDIFHDKGGVFYHAGEKDRIAGPETGHKSYGSFAAFEDPDGNRWILQEVTERLPGR